LNNVTFPEAAAIRKLTSKALNKIHLQPALDEIEGIVSKAAEDGYSNVEITWAELATMVVAPPELRILIHTYLRARGYSMTTGPQTVCIDWSKND